MIGWERGRWMGGWMDRQIDNQIDKWIQRQRDREIEKQRKKLKDREKDRERDRERDIYIDRQNFDRQIHRQGMLALQYPTHQMSPQHMKKMQNNQK